MTYIQKKAEEIANHAGINVQEDGDLCLIYAVLALTKGGSTTLKDVHDAWAAWKHLRGINEHKSLKPFDQLTTAVQELDRPYMEAIHAAAGIPKLTNQPTEP